MVNFPKNPSKKQKSKLFSYLDNIYSDIKSGGSFTSPSKLLREVKRRNFYQNISLKIIIEFLENKPEYTLYRQNKTRFYKPPVIVNGPHIQFQTDLVDVSRFKLENDNVTFLLVCIDAFSRFALVRPLLSKNSNSVVTAMRDILDKYEIKVIESDFGSEYKDKNYISLLKGKGIRQFYTGASLHASIAERFNKTLKIKISKLQRKRHSLKYIDKLPDIVLSYNKTYHSSIKMRPLDVNSNNEVEVYENLYANKKIPPKHKYLYKVGRKVRIASEKGPFTRIFHQNFTEEIFTISDRYRVYNIPLYKVKDCSGEVIRGSFYAQELSPVGDDSQKYFEIKSVLGHKFVNGVKFLKVNFVDYPPECYEWVNKSSIQNIK